MDRKSCVKPLSKKYAGCMAKIQTLRNGRVMLSVHDKEMKMMLHRECDSKEEAKRLLQLSGQQFQKVQETIIYVVKE